MTRRGLLGGTFDPIHRAISTSPRPRAARSDSTRVWLVPARVPPHRDAPHASAAHRFAMAALAVANRQALSRLGPGDGRRRRRPTRRRRWTGWRRGAWTSASSFFITGADAFRDIAHVEGLSRPFSTAATSSSCPGRAVRRRRCGDILPDTGRSHDRRAAPRSRLDAGDLSGGRADRAGVVDRRPARGIADRRRRSTDWCRDAVAAYIRQARSVLARSTKDSHEDDRETRRASAPPPRASPTELTAGIAAALDKKAARRRRARSVEGVGVHRLLRDLHRHATCARSRPSPTPSQEAIGKTRREAGADRRLRARRVDPASTTSTSSSTCSCRRTREFYGLERLWGDAERIEVSA